MLQSGRIEQVIDQRVKPFHVVEHEPYEVSLLLGADLPPAQRLQIEFQRCQRRFQFVRHAVNEIRLAAIQVDRFDRQGQIHDDADQHKREKRGADGQQRPVERRPATIGECAECR